jgi:nudix-type nucleoside diphosphatase (YffH/AdpP family)
MKTSEIINEKIVFKDKLILEKGELKTNGVKYHRLRINREDAVAVLIFNTNSNNVILTKQFRYAIADKANTDILEIVAGKIEEGEDPLKTAIRESEEETGYKIDPEKITILLSCFSSPGYSSERFIIYYATVTDKDKVADGGGKESENEHIEIVEMELPEFLENIKMANFKDAKTYLAGLFLMLHKILV